MAGGRALVTLRPILRTVSAAATALLVACVGSSSETAGPNEDLGTAAPPGGSANSALTPATSSASPANPTHPRLQQSVDALNSGDPELVAAALALPLRPCTKDESVQGPSCPTGVADRTLVPSLGLAGCGGYFVAGSEIDAYVRDNFPPRASRRVTGVYRDAAGQLIAPMVDDAGVATFIVFLSGEGIVGFGTPCGEPGPPRVPPDVTWIIGGPLRPGAEATQPLSPAEELVVSEALMIRKGLAAASGQLIPADSGPFPRRLEGQLLYVLDRCRKLVELEIPRNSAVADLRAVTSDVCADIEAVGGIESPKVSYPGEPYTPPRIAADAAFKSRLVSDAVGWRERIEKQLLRNGLISQAEIGSHG
jgi:hypothetical protein